MFEWLEWDLESSEISLERLDLLRLEISLEWVIDTLESREMSLERPTGHELSIDTLESSEISPERPVTRVEERWRAGVEYHFQEI